MPCDVPEVCIKRGRSAKIVVVGGHHDSTSERPSTDAPGAIDNGSGSIGALAIAEAVSKSGLEFDATLHFVFFGGEEQGLYGSYHYVEEATAANLDISHALIMDMIGYSSKYYGVTLEGQCRLATHLRLQRQRHRHARPCQRVVRMVCTQNTTPPPTTGRPRGLSPHGFCRAHPCRHQHARMPGAHGAG